MSTLTTAPAFLTVRSSACLLVCPSTNFFSLVFVRLLSADVHPRTQLLCTERASSLCRAVTYHYDTHRDRRLRRACYSVGDLSLLRHGDPAAGTGLVFGPVESFLRSLLPRK